VVLTAANAHDSTMLGAVVDDIPPIRVPTRRRRRRPGTVHADKGYDYPYERSDERFFTFAMLACSAILFNTLQQPPW
jgi:hypothetical protein